MDFVSELEQEFRKLLNSNNNNIESLVDILKKHSINNKQRWDVLRCIVSENKEFLVNVTTKEIEEEYLQIKEDLIECPAIIDIVVMNLHSQYKNYPYLNLIEIQKKCFGEETFKLIEKATINFLEKHYEKMFSDPRTNLNLYIQDYKDYYYFPTILKIINKFS